MTWGLAFRLQQWAKSSMWLLPALGVVAGWALALITVAIDETTTQVFLWTYSASTATSLLSAIVGAMVALTGFVVTVVTLGVQMATGTFSARYMRLWYRDLMLKGLLAFLIGTLSFAFMGIRYVEDPFVPNLTVTLAGLAVTVSLLFFVIYLDHFLHHLRPVAVAAQVAREGRLAFEQWQRLSQGPRASIHPLGALLPPSPPELSVRSAAAGTIQAIDTRGLARLAASHGCLIVFHHSIGDFVPKDARLFSVYGKGVPALAEQRLQAMVALGIERTLEQDPMFALRIMVDIAELALSPAVNAPTTAVQVLDHLGETLRLIGTSDLPMPDELPPVGVLLPMRRWEEFLDLGITEIREYGAASVQVMRRLRALLLELGELVPPERREAVAEQLRRLDATVERSFGTTEDLDMARQADTQGLGGPSRPTSQSVSG